MGCGPFRWAEPLYRPPGKLFGKQTCSSKAGRHRTTCKEFQHQRCPHWRHVVLTTLLLEAINCRFCPVFTCDLRKYGLWYFLQAPEPWCPAPGELLGKQACSSKAERHCTTCEGFQGKKCHHFRHVVRTTLMRRAPNCHFCPDFTCFLRENALQSFPLGRVPLCCRRGELLGKQTCSARVERHRTTCKEFQEQ